VDRTLGNPSSFTSAVVQRIRSVDREQPVYDVRTMKQWRDRSLRQRHLTTGLISAFAGASFLLALLGVYGVLSYVTTTRTREFGIRIALGATQSSVQRLVLRQAFRLGGSGLLIGVVPSIALVMLIRSQLFDVPTTDSFVLIGTVALVFCTTVLAAIIPARRAMHTDPLTSLRQE
jgi:ABC-type antimicrobial peptide transport system permease subunit